MLKPAISFRQDIQGMRAIAVAIVALAHAGVPGFSGGFVGVDVFFVISGYLITGLLVSERMDTGARTLWPLSCASIAAVVASTSRDAGDRAVGLPESVVQL